MGTEFTHGLMDPLTYYFIYVFSHTKGCFIKTDAMVTEFTHGQMDPLILVHSIWTGRKVMVSLSFLMEINLR